MTRVNSTPKKIKARETAAFGGVSLALREPQMDFFFAPILTRMVLKLPLYHEGSEYVLSFEIGQRQVGFYSTQTDTQNYPVPHSNIHRYPHKI